MEIAVRPEIVRCPYSGRWAVRSHCNALHMYFTARREWECDWDDGLDYDYDSQEQAEEALAVWELMAASGVRMRLVVEPV